MIVPAAGSFDDKVRRKSRSRIEMCSNADSVGRTPVSLLRRRDEMRGLLSSAGSASAYVCWSQVSAACFSILP